MKGNAMEVKTSGQVAYEAYCGHTDWKSLVSGALLPQWADAKPEIQAAWEVAAAAVRKPLEDKLAAILFE